MITSITDPAAVDRLPPGTILMDHTGTAWRRGTGSWVSTSEDGDGTVPLPAHVLYSPADLHPTYPGSTSTEEGAMPDPMIDLAMAVIAAHDLAPDAPGVLCKCSWEPDWRPSTRGFWAEQYDRHRAEALSRAGLLTWPVPTCTTCQQPVTPVHVSTEKWAESRQCAACLNGDPA